MNYTDKWNNYKIGDIVWINKRRGHHCRKLFVDYIKSTDHKSVLDIGAGECIEARELFGIVNYTICDVSETFLAFAKGIGLNTIKGCMTDIPTQVKFDMVYMCSVLEHTPDIEKTIQELRRVSKFYFITMFKWRYDGDLESVFRPKKNYYSTEFNIDKIFELFEKYSVITNKFITYQDDKNIMNYSDYIKKIRISGIHRNGNYLSIVGKWNGC